MTRRWLIFLLALLAVSPLKADGATNQVSVTAATNPATTIVAARSGRYSVIITNITGSDKLCIGFTSAVTAATGECLPPIAGTSITLSTAVTIYGVVPTIAQTVSFLELF